ncbi:DUF1330 domain-containing protein [Phenylobacterium sp.]|uniref:DUF1330 domain-containing protein n=1 Tax=Phenylobacterium sp. TaxID=1871053 RepID=UPI002FE1A309
MKAYLVLDFEVTHLRDFMAYVAAIPAHIGRHGGRYVVQGAKPTVVEGDWRPQRLVVIEFPSRADAEAFLADPDCRTLFEVRRRTTISRLVLVDGPP